MKILTTKKANEIDVLTTHLHDFIHNLQNDSLKTVLEKRSYIRKINDIRSICELPAIVSLTSFHPMPEVKPPKKEGCKHIFKIAYTRDNAPFLFCENCGEIKFITIGMLKQDGADMKEQKLYVCEYCNTQFKEKEEALKCEESHRTAKAIKSAGYHRAVSIPDDYPDILMIEFDNGKVERYKRG